MNTYTQVLYNSIENKYFSFTEGNFLNLLKHTTSDPHSQKLICSLSIIFCFYFMNYFITAVKNALLPNILLMNRLHLRGNI